MSNAAAFGAVCSGLLPTYQLASAVQQRAPRIAGLQHRNEHRSSQQQTDVEQSDAAQQAPGRSFSQCQTHIDGGIYLDHALDWPAVDAADDLPLGAADHACGEGVVQAEGVACIYQQTCLCPSMDAGILHRRETDFSGKSNQRDSGQSRWHAWSATRCCSWIRLTYCIHTLPNLQVGGVSQVQRVQNLHVHMMCSDGNAR